MTPHDRGGDVTDAAMVNGVLSSASPDTDGWEDPPRRLPEAWSPVLTVEGFEGPLDWLLEMARTRKLDLQRLSILALIDCFVDAMQAALPPDAPAPAPTLAVTRWASWTVMATQLAEMRSQLLLPLAGPNAESAQTEAEVRRRRRLGRAEMMAVADWLEQRPQLGRTCLHGDGRNRDGLGREANLDAR